MPLLGSPRSRSCHLVPRMILGTIPQTAPHDLSTKCARAPVSTSDMPMYSGAKPKRITSVQVRKSPITAARDQRFSIACIAASAEAERDPERPVSPDREAETRLEVPGGIHLRCGE